MDLKQLKDLFSDHDIEGLIAMHGAPLDEYDEEATKLTRRLKDLELDKTKIDHTAIVDALIGIWSESFNLSSAELEKRRQNLTKLALEVEKLCVKSL
jgi:hypothetical protein